MPAPQPLPSRLIGALFVERGLVSESQIKVALEIQNESGQQLGQVLVERFGVSRKELASVVAEQWAKLGGSAGPEDTASWRRLGEIFVDRGFVTQDELDQALTRQRQTGERLGEALVAQGVISKFELAGALAEQMASLENPTAADPLPAEPTEATVHHLPARVEEAPTEAASGAALELVPAEEPQDDGTEAEAVETEADLETETEPVQAEVAETEIADEVAVEDVSEPAEDVGDVALVETELVTEPERVPEPEAEPEAALEDASEPEPEPDAAFEDASEPEPEPEPVLETDPPAPILSEVPFVDDGLPEPAIACFAFAPTTSGYRLVPLDELPVPGETIDVPDVGQRVVLRVGPSPHPLDERICAFVEEPVVVPFELAVH